MNQKHTETLQRSIRIQVTFYSNEKGNTRVTSHFLFGLVLLRTVKQETFTTRKHM